MGLAGLEFFQKGTDFHGRCDEKHRPDDLFDGAVRIINKVVEIFLVDNTDDVVDIFFINRKSGKSGIQEIFAISSLDSSRETLTISTRGV